MELSDMKPNYKMFQIKEFCKLVRERTELCSYTVRVINMEKKKGWKSLDI